MNLVLLIGIVILSSVIWLAFARYRSILRYAKGVERGLKMVPILINLPPSSDDTEVGSRDVRDVLEEKISQAETLYNVIASTAQKGFKSKFYGQRHIAFEIVATKGTVNYYVAVPVPMVAVVEQAILSAYPTAHLEEAEEHNIFSPVGKISGTMGGELDLKESYSYPIATFKDTKRDAMQSLLNALTSLTEEDGAAIQLLIRPAHSGWDKNSKSLVDSKKKDKGKKKGLSALLSAKDLIEAPFKPPEAKESEPEDKQLTTLEQGVLDSIENKTRHPGYETLIRIVTSSNTAQRSQVLLHNIVAAFSLFDAPGLNGFKFNPAKDIENFVTAFIFRFFPPELNKNILNSVELATIFHFPDQQFTPSSQLQRQGSKQVDGPHNIPDSGLLLGYNVFRGSKKEVRLSDGDRRRHVYIIGQTGTGKSVLLENMALQDMLTGKGFAFIDPHGDTVETLISMIPKERTEDIIYFNPGDMEHPLGLNLFEFSRPEQKDFLIQEAINMLYKLYDPQRQGIIGPRYEHWFRNAALTLMSDPNGATFIEIPKVFTDKQYLREKLKHVKDPTVLDFWNKEMAQTTDYHKSEILGWFVSKFGAFMSNEMMRNIIGQTKSAFDLRQVMDNKKIVLVNLSKGQVGELNSKLLGMIFVMKFQAAAMSRASIPEEERVDFSLYVDEFQNFSTDSFEKILSEARKYRLNLVVANQFIGQLTEEIRDAVFGNVGTVISLRAGAADSEFLVKQFAPVFDTQDLLKLPNYHALIRLMIGGVPSQPFSMVTIPPFGSPSKELGKALKQLSSAKYGKPRSAVEKDIFKRLESPPLPSRPPLNRPAGTARPKTPGSSSFLDDWLAKRKAQQANRGPLQKPSMNRPVSNMSPARPSDQIRPAQNKPYSEARTPQTQNQEITSTQNSQSQQINNNNRNKRLSQLPQDSADSDTNSQLSSFNANQHFKINRDDVVQEQHHDLSSPGTQELPKTPQQTQDESLPSIENVRSGINPIPPEGSSSVNQQTSYKDNSPGGTNKNTNIRNETPVNQALNNSENDIEEVAAILKDKLRNNSDQSAEGTNVGSGEQTDSNKESASTDSNNNQTRRGDKQIYIDKYGNVHQDK